MYQNRATLIGFLGKDAEVKHARNNTTYTILSLATKRSWKDRESGEWASQTTWHRCIVFGKLSEFAATLGKGTHLQVEGDIRTHEYIEKGGARNPLDVKKSITEVRVSSLTKMDRPAKPGAAEAEPVGVPS